MESTTTANTLQESNTREWLISRKEFQLIDDPKLIRRNRVIRCRDKKKSHAQVEENPFDVRNMRPYINTKRETIPPEKLTYQPTNNTK